MFTELVRLGRDSNVKQLESGTSVANLACAYDIGYGENKRTQWLDLAVFGKQAEALGQYFTKGRKFMITAKDVCTEEYEKRDGGGIGMRLKATAVDLKFAGSRDDNQVQQQTQTQFGTQQHAQTQFQQAPTQQAPQPIPQPQYAPQPQQIQQQPNLGQAPNGEDIPF